MDKQEEALADYRRLVALDPQTPARYAEWIDDGPPRFAEAIRTLEAELAKGEAEATGHYKQAFVHHRKGELRRHTI